MYDECKLCGKDLYGKDELQLKKSLDIHFISRHKYSETLNSRNKKIKVNLNSTEFKALKYLENEGFKINNDKSKKYFKADFIGNREKYEIKRINLSSSKQISFTKGQMERFDDDIKILAFLPMSDEPYLSCTMKDVRAKVNLKDVKICVSKD